MRPLQEKFQITVPNKKESDEGGWVFPGVDNSTAGAARDDDVLVNPNKLNFMPPGMELDNQRNTDVEPMPLSLEGRTDVSSKSTEPDALIRGFSNLQMKGCDDQYTGEHVDHFYGDAGGFVERNNYLDRE